MSRGVCQITLLAHRTRLTVSPSCTSTVSKLWRCAFVRSNSAEAAMMVFRHAANKRDLHATVRIRAAAAAAAAAALLAASTVYQ